MTHDVFISHSTMDKTAADAVCTALESQGLRCWIAPRDISAGKDWGAAIIQAIKDARMVVLIFSANADNSHPVKSEIERAYNKQIPIIPFRIEDAPPSGSLEFFLSSRQWLNAFPPPLDGHLQHLGQVVRQIMEDSSRDEAIKKVRDAKVDEDKRRVKAREEKGSVSETHSPAVIPGNRHGERRPVTVLFAGIMNSAALYERLDSEEAAAMIGECLKELAGTVYESGGIVDKSSGENVMAVFGAPVASEDDAERALRAALSMKEKLQAISRDWNKKLGKPLDFHIGVNTGEVIAGTVNSDSPAGFAVLGDAVNMASDLLAAAEPEQILIGQKTVQMTRGLFIFKEPRFVAVKGRAAPLPAHELLHAKIQPSKIRGLEGLTPTFVGREREHQMLRKALGELKKGSGQIVTVIGEAGVGKSRLISEIRNASDELTWLEGHCFAYSRALSYGPFLDLLRRFAGIADEDGEIQVRANLRARLGKFFPQDSRLYAIFAHLLSMRLESDEAGIIGKMTGESFRKELFAAMEKFFTGLAAEKPVVIVLEDLHWADQSSIELAGHLCSLTACAPVAMIALFRSREEASDNWGKFAPAIEGFRDRYSEISLLPLSGDLSRDLVGGLLNGTALPQKFYDLVIDKSEGNPFFVEELLRSLMERGILAREGAGWKITGLAEAMQVPDTLQGILLSRLDRLPEQTKRVVQKAAVIGRVFLYRILKHMAQGEGELDLQMTLIEDAELVRERSRLPEIEYMFNHALTQEVAYKTLLLPARKDLHQRVGQAMESVFAERLEEFTGLLAYHYFFGEAWQKALEFSARAADYASALYAYAESREHYRRALESLTHLPDTGFNRQKKMDLILNLVSVSLQAVAPEQNLSLLADAEKLARQEQDRLRLARIQLWIGRVYYLAGKTRDAIGYFQQVLPVASESNDPDLLSLPGAVIGRALFMQGDFTRARQLLEQAIPLLEAAKNHREILFAYIYRGGARTALGDFAGGSADITHALKMARAARNQNAETMAQTGFALIKLIAGRHAEAMVHAREALLVAEKTGDAMFRYSSNAFMAWGLTGIGDHARAVVHWKAAHEAATPLGGYLLLGDWLAAMESETYCEQRNWTVAVEKAQLAIAMARSAGSVIAEGLALRVLGCIEAGQSHWPEAEDYLAKSASLFEKINARFDLARTVLCQGKVAAAKKDPAAATEFFQRAIELAGSCGLQREENNARSLKASLPASI